MEWTRRRSCSEARLVGPRWCLPSVVARLVHALAEMSLSLALHVPGDCCSAIAPLSHLSPVFFISKPGCRTSADLWPSLVIRQDFLRGTVASIKPFGVLDVRQPLVPPHRDRLQILCLPIPRFRPRTGPPPDAGRSFSRRNRQAGFARAADTATRASAWFWCPALMGRFRCPTPICPQMKRHRALRLCLLVHI